MLRIKKHHSKNEYLLAGNVWVRNLCKKKVPYLNLNHTAAEDFETFMENEAENKKIVARNITAETWSFPNVLIVSNGYKFEDKHLFLHELPYNKVNIMAVNRALRDWKLINNCSPEHRRAINYLVVNNPYKECMRFLPKDHKYFPPCIASIRTNFEFCENYQGDIIFYPPTNDKNYSGWKYPANYYVDDYRNPISAALSLAREFKAKRIMLFCCDDSFEENKPGSVKLDNNLFCYPQQLLSHSIIDAQLYWLKQAGIKVADYSSGPKYEHAEYIQEDRQALSFFKDEDG